MWFLLFFSPFHLFISLWCARSKLCFLSYGVSQYDSIYLIYIRTLVLYDEIKEWGFYVFTPSSCLVSGFAIVAMELELAEDNNLQSATKMC